MQKQINIVDVANKLALISCYSHVACEKIIVQIKSQICLDDMNTQHELFLFFYLIIYQLPKICLFSDNKKKRLEKRVLTKTTFFSILKILSFIQKKNATLFIFNMLLLTKATNLLYSLKAYPQKGRVALILETLPIKLFLDLFDFFDYFLFKIKIQVNLNLPTCHKQYTSVLHYNRLWLLKSIDE